MAIERVSADVISFVDDEHSLASGGKALGTHCARKAGSHDQDVIFHLSKSSRKTQRWLPFMSSAPHMDGRGDLPGRRAAPLRHRQALGRHLSPSKNASSFKAGMNWTVPGNPVILSCGHKDHVAERKGAPLQFRLRYDFAHSAVPVAHGEKLDPCPRARFADAHFVWRKNYRSVMQSRDRDRRNHPILKNVFNFLMIRLMKPNSTSVIK
ncbi:hypothetical protein [Paraburkholderia sp. SIMBA_030]|uniref:hypothetical protein n=1 Tax=Paraburkholderia sp. SIMBA_030 TaxID=3085773 RepID=UPI00397D0A9F